MLHLHRVPHFGGFWNFPSVRPHTLSAFDSDDFFDEIMDGFEVMDSLWGDRLQGRRCAPCQPRRQRHAPPSPARDAVEDQPGSGDVAPAAAAPEQGAPDAEMADEGHIEVVKSEEKRQDDAPAAEVTEGRAGTEVVPPQDPSHAAVAAPARGRGVGFFGSRLWTPRMDVQVTEEEVAVVADLPGVAPEAVRAEVVQGVLTLSGERRSEERRGGYMERSFGRFERSVRLPSDVKAEDAVASFENGVLRISLKRERREPRRIAIRGVGGA